MPALVVLLTVSPVPAPPPAIEKPTGEKFAARAAVRARLVRLAVSVAVTLTALRAERPSLTFLIAAVTRFSITLSAAATAMEAAAPPPNPTEAATEAAPVSTLSDEASRAETVTVPAEILPLVPSPSMVALTCAAMRLCVPAPAPAALTAMAPALIATEPARIVALIVWPDTAVTSRLPWASIFVSFESASITRADERAEPRLLPIRFVATPTPMLAPTATPPMLTPAAIAATEASIRLLFAALTAISPEAFSVAALTLALVLPPIRFVATAPPPATETATPPPEIDTAAAATLALMLAPSTPAVAGSSAGTSASTRIPPERAVTLPPSITALSALSMTFSAVATPIDGAPPTPPKAAATAAAPTSTLIAAWSLARTVTSAAVTLPAPRMAALVAKLIALPEKLPAPATPTATAAPVTTAAADATVASMVLAEVAVTTTLPAASTIVSPITASTRAPPSVTSVGWSRREPSAAVVRQLPMMFWAPERPIATGTLAMPAPPPAAASETTVASMSWLLVAATRSAAPLVTLLRAVWPAAFAITARVLVVMMLTAEAPPPETWTLAMPAPPKLSDAAEAIALIEPPLVASTETSPVVEVTPVSALPIVASTVLPIVLVAKDRETATPTLAAPAPLPAMPDAPTEAVISESSLAAMAMPEALTPLAPSPSMAARVLTAMVLVAPTPAPATLTPAAPPPWIAAETAATSALMVWLEVARIPSAESESKLESLR
ncbi:hypothetical protein HPGCJGGD_3734 [Methylobacterium haplocladii]|nr:hypothetical protein HPGCJGGD_3734 [Methylobacterium haplocladii]